MNKMISLPILFQKTTLYPLYGKLQQHRNPEQISRVALPVSFFPK